MKTIEKWADRVYAETDFGRSVATSCAGIIGLITYLASSDWVIAAFSSIISFPIIRLISTGLHEKVNRNKQRKIEREEAEHIYNRLSDEEKEVIQAFVSAGGSVLTWSQMNSQPVSSASIESLIQREVLWTSMTADGMRETFALNSAIFDIGNEKLALNKNS
jgi:hypothetical protein